MIEKVVSFIKKGNAVAFCGAGFSAESNIPTFRGKGGLWDKYDPAVYVSVKGIRQLFSSQPEELKNFIIDCYEVMLAASPHRVHHSLYDLEARGYLTGIITQNIDDLQNQAGSGNIAEIHGNAYVFRCSDCLFRVKKAKKDWRDFIDRLKSLSEKRTIRKLILEFAGKCPRCKVSLESGVVFFGQVLPESEINKSFQYLKRADIVLCIGTSGLVYPAASFPLYARERGAFIVNINPHESALDAQADLCFKEKAGQFFEKLSLHL